MIANHDDSSHYTTTFYFIYLLMSEIWKLSANIHKLTMVINQNNKLQIYIVLPTFDVIVTISLSLSVSDSSSLSLLFSECFGMRESLPPQAMPFEAMVVLEMHCECSLVARSFVSSKTLQCVIF